MLRVWGGHVGVAWAALQTGFLSMRYAHDGGRRRRRDLPQEQEALLREELKRHQELEEDPSEPLSEEYHRELHEVLSKYAPELQAQPHLLDDPSFGLRLLRYTHQDVCLGELVGLSRDCLHADAYVSAMNQFRRVVWDEEALHQFEEEGLREEMDQLKKDMPEPLDADASAEEWKAWREAAAQEILQQQTRRIQEEDEAHTSAWFRKSTTDEEVADRVIKETTYMMSHRLFDDMDPEAWQQHIDVWRDELREAKTRIKDTLPSSEDDLNPWLWKRFSELSGYDCVDMADRELGEVSKTIHCWANQQGCEKEIDEFRQLLKRQRVLLPEKVVYELMKTSQETLENPMNREKLENLVKDMREQGKIEEANTLERVATEGTAWLQEKARQRAVTVLQELGGTGNDPYETLKNTGFPLWRMELVAGPAVVLTKRREVLEDRGWTDQVNAEMQEAERESTTATLLSRPGGPMDFSIPPEQRIGYIRMKTETEWEREVKKRAYRQRKTDPLLNTET